MKRALVLGLLAIAASSACLNQASASARQDQVVRPAPRPVSSTPAVSPQAAALPRAVFLRVPYTTQAPLGDWGAMQHTCEEASLLMVDSYLQGDRSARPIDRLTADRAIHQITTWKPFVDLTPQQLGEMAQEHMGWAYSIHTADRLGMEQQLALGNPLIVGVRTHGLGNPNYPGYLTNYEQPGWSVSHYLVVVGYDSSGRFILNDPGITLGQGSRITFNQLMHAIDDLDHAYPNLDAGRVFLVLTTAPGNS